MNNLYPVYTLKNECHDCYKCIRECPVKAIKIENGHASVIPEKCISCGLCTTICPQNAKKIRYDVNKSRTQFITQKKVVASIAPSWTGVFDITDSQMISALKQLGFDEVSQTALGAQEVSIETAKILSGNKKGLFISSACPAIVDYIRLYAPEFSENITPVASPALTHAKMIKQEFGEDTAVVFIGPCIAKKNEADSHPDIMPVALTFQELKNWFEQENIDFNKCSQDEKFALDEACEGGLYPLEGGMNETIRKCGISDEAQLISVSSIPTFKEALKNLDKVNIDKTIFIEALACDGGCINGPARGCEKAGIAMMSDVLSKVKTRENIPSNPSLVYNLKYPKREIQKKEYPLEDIIATMQSIGKHSLEDELNCGGCGYDTCRELAQALLAGEAEPSMCVSYMRKIATKKAGAMLRFMPSGIVMVDNEMKVIETNDAFMKMFAPDLYDVFKNSINGMAGASIEKIFPCADIFKSALRLGSEIHKERYPIEKNLYDITAFTIEPNLIVGAVITDVTKTEMKRDQIAKKAQEVIAKNTTIVQEIACLLGEHMVDTELLLSSISQGYESENKELE